jgi:hypothetical protein
VSGWLDGWIQIYYILIAEPLWHDSPNNKYILDSKVANINQDENNSSQNCKYLLDVNLTIFFPRFKVDKFCECIFDRILY